MATVESVSNDEKETWRLIRKEFEEIGTSVAAFEANKGFIMSWFRQALESGALEEQNFRNDDNVFLHTSSKQTGGPNAESSEIVRSLRSRASTIEELEDLSLETDKKTPIGQQQNSGPHKAVSIVQQQSIMPERPRSIKARKVVTPIKPEQPRPYTNSKKPPKLFSLVSVMFRYEKKFHEHCRNDHLNEAEVLLEKGVDVDCLSEGITAFYIAARRRKPKTLQFLWDAGANIELSDPTYRTPLYAAVESSEKFGSGSEMEADYKTVKYLLEIGASVRDVTVHVVRPPLMTAIGRWNPWCVKLLLEYGAGVENADGKYNKALEFALEYRTASIVNLLLDYGASVNSTDTRGRSMLACAVVCA